MAMVRFQPAGAGVNSITIEWGLKNEYCYIQTLVIKNVHISQMKAIKLIIARIFVEYHQEWSISISSDNGLVLNRRQIIIWTNDED